MPAKSSKKLTYLLIIAVAGVWGIIFYRIFSSAGGDGAISGILQQEQKEDISVSYELKDTFSLALNYRDPFLEDGNGLKPEVNDPAKELVQPQTARVQPLPVNFDFLAYCGYIINPSSRKVISLLTFNGKEKMMEDGELAEGVKLLKNYKDSVKVSYQGKIKYIRLK